MKIILSLSFILSIHAVLGQFNQGLEASFDFNDGDISDAIHHTNAELSSALFAKDRFGNKKHAIYLQGTKASYVILGREDYLKPETGSISLWLKIENKIFNGQGVMSNPVIFTKSNPSDDFFEGYLIHIDIVANKLGFGMATDEQNQAACRTVDEVAFNSWLHVVTTYDKDSLKLFIDGELEASVAKPFNPQFLKNEPVILGSYMNVKNERYLNGYVDDVKIYNRVLSLDEIQSLYHTPNPVRWKIVLQYALIILACILFLLLIIFISRLRIRHVIRREQERTALLQKSRETEMRMLKSQMDPHFIFNSLNSVQQLILANENDKAQSYLSKFSRLLRKSIESNMNDRISLYDEIDMLKKYIEMESMRFQTAIQTNVELQDNIDAKQILIPPMLLQPVVENAIWHGLLKKEGGEKLISMKFSLPSEKKLSCIVEDNGAGFNEKYIQNEKKENKSLALQFIKQRLELMSQLFHEYYFIEIKNRNLLIEQETGATVTLHIPVLIKIQYAEINHN